MKRLHMEHLPLRAQHDGRSVPTHARTQAHIHKHTHTYTGTHGLSLSVSSALPPPPLLKIFARPQGLPADVPFCSVPPSLGEPVFGESQAPEQACVGAYFTKVNI